jgi:hypothetical protein
MSDLTRRQVIQAGAAAGAVLVAGAANAGPEKEKASSFEELFLPTQLTKEDIETSKGAKFTKLEFVGATFWVGIVDFLGGGVPHTWIGIYAPHAEGGFRRSLFAESWAAGKLEAGVDVKTGMLELRERANSELKDQLILSCSLKTIGTQHSIQGK